MRLFSVGTSQRLNSPRAVILPSAASLRLFTIIPNLSISKRLSPIFPSPIDWRSIPFKKIPKACDLAFGLLPQLLFYFTPTHTTVKVLLNFFDGIEVSLRRTVVRAFCHFRLHFDQRIKSRLDLIVLPSRLLPEIHIMNHCLK